MNTETLKWNIQFESHNMRTTAVGSTLTLFNWSSEVSVGGFLEVEGDRELEGARVLEGDRVRGLAGRSVS
ncbi:hypothetical protein ACLKA6_017711 [Drosophila palustris]